jgi:hypothetical protein
MDNEFVRRRSARLVAQAEYLAEGQERARHRELGHELRDHNLPVQQRLLDLIRPITDDDPNISWQDFVEAAIDRLFKEANRLEDVRAGLPPQSICAIFILIGEMMSHANRGSREPIPNSLRK